jgi:hypothetical protein
MKKVILTLARALLFTSALLAEYPKDAAARFKMKYGVDHPVVAQEKREADTKRANAHQEARIGAPSGSDKRGGQVPEVAEVCSAPCNESASNRGEATTPVTD